MLARNGRKEGGLANVQSNRNGSWDRLSRPGRHLIKMSPNPIKDWQPTLVEEAGFVQYLISI